MSEKHKITYIFNHYSGNRMSGEFGIDPESSPEEGLKLIKHHISKLVESTGFLTDGRKILEEYLDKEAVKSPESQKEIKELESKDRGKKDGLKAIPEMTIMNDGEVNSPFIVIKKLGNTIEVMGEFKRKKEALDFIDNKTANKDLINAQIGGE